MGNPICEMLGIRYPIIQGAMTRLLPLFAGRYGCRRCCGIHKAPRVRHGHYTDHAVWQAPATFPEAVLKLCNLPFVKSQSSALTFEGMAGWHIEQIQAEQSL